MNRPTENNPTIRFVSSNDGKGNADSEKGKDVSEAKDISEVRENFGQGLGYPSAKVSEIKGTNQKMESFERMGSVPTHFGSQNQAAPLREDVNALLSKFAGKQQASITDVYHN